MELEQQVTEVITEVKAALVEVKGAREKEREEVKIIGTASAETKSLVEKLEERFTKAQTQLDALDAKMADRHVPDREMEEKSLGQSMTEHPMYAERMKAGWAGRASTNMVFDSSAFAGRKSVIWTGGVGTGTTGVQMPQRLFETPLGLPIQELRVRDLLTVRKMTTGNSFDYPVQNLRTNAASPQQETSPKSESTYGWTSTIGAIRTIAHYTNVSKQALDDIPWMRGTIDDELRYGLLLKEESEILAGSGVGEHLNGIITQATAYDSGTYNVTGDTKIDKIRHGKLQARLAGLATFAPDGIVLNPRDMHDIELVKSDEGTTANRGLYIMGNPTGGPPIKVLWGLPVVESDSITYGTFLLGAFRSGAVLVDRMVVSIEISFEHDVNFTKNLATVLCEERIGLGVTRPAAFISGSFT